MLVSNQSFTETKCGGSYDNTALLTTYESTSSCGKPLYQSLLVFRCTSSNGFSSRHVCKGNNEVQTQLFRNNDCSGTPLREDTLWKGDECKHNMRLVNCGTNSFN